jgi:threonine dehydrogenase-like Zn-dependent dehydrogenase
LMRAVMIEAPGSVMVGHVPDPVPGQAALVRIERAGLCGTDLKIVSGAIPVARQRILGHELVGRVAVAGQRRQVPEGTRVLIDPGIACGQCPVCLRDRPHLCPAGALMGRDVDGGCADYVAVDEDRLHPVPDEISADAAASLQVLATCVHAQECVAAFPDQTAVVVGLGVSGLLHTQLLHLRGVRQVIGVTRSPWKRELAVSLGADAAVSPDDAAAAVAEATGGRGADLVVECAGTPHTLRQAMLLAGPGGTVLVFGTTVEADAMPTYHWYYKELTIVCPRSARPRDFSRAITLARHQLRLAPLVTAAYPLEAVAEALESCSGPDRLKVVLEV